MCAVRAGREGLAQLAAIITDQSNREALPSAIKQALQAIVDQLAALELQIGTLDRAIHAHHRANDMSCRLETVPGIGVIGATPSLPLSQTRVTSNPVGILQHGSDLCRGSTRRGAKSSSAASPSREIAISDGFSSSVQQPLFDTPGQHPQKHFWVMRLLAKKPAKLVAVAVANKMRASLGRSWPREDTIERRSLLQPPEEAWQWKREATAGRDNRIARVMMA